MGFPSPSSVIKACLYRATHSLLTGNVLWLKNFAKGSWPKSVLFSPRMTGMSQGCEKLGMKGSSSRPAICWSCDLGQAAFPLCFLFRNRAGDWRRSGWYRTTVSSKFNLVKYSSLPSHITLFYFMHSTFHIAGDLGYLFTYWSVCLPD